MNRIILTLVFSSMFLWLSAQVEVVLRVDMAGETISAEGLFLIGSFQDWSIDDRIEMLNEGDDIYEATIDLAIGSYEYSYLNGFTEPTRECEVDGTCQDVCFTENIDGDRVRVLEVEENVSRQTLAAYKYNSCEETLPASIEEIKNNRNLSINPNPFSVETTLAFTNPKNQSFDVLIFDASGRMIRNFESLNGDKFEIQRDDLATGLYLLTIRTDKGEVASRKLLVL